MQGTDLARFPVWAVILETMMLFACAPKEDQYVRETDTHDKVPVDLGCEQGWRTLLKYIILYMFDRKAGGSVGTDEAGDCDLYRRQYKDDKDDWWTVVSWFTVTV